MHSLLGAFLCFCISVFLVRMHLQPKNSVSGKHSYPSSHTNHGCLCQAVRLLSEPEGDEQREKEMISRWAGKEGISFLPFFYFSPWLIIAVTLSLQGCQRTISSQSLIFWFHYLPLKMCCSILTEKARIQEVCVRMWVCGGFYWSQVIKKKVRCPFYKARISGRNEVIPGQKGKAVDKNTLLLSLAFPCLQCLYLQSPDARTKESQNVFGLGSRIQSLSKWSDLIPIKSICSIQNPISELSVIMQLQAQWWGWGGGITGRVAWGRE